VHLGSVLLQGAPWQLVDLGRTLLSGDVALGRSLIEEIGQRADLEAAAAARAALVGWSERAKWATAGSAQAGHRFAKGPRGFVDDVGFALPKVGKEALELLQAEWLPRWLDSSRSASGVALLHGAASEAALPAITLRMLDDTLKTYGDAVGLGVDCLHPRSILLLLDRYFALLGSSAAEAEAVGQPDCVYRQA
jgi:hypothetical protein